MGFKINSDTVIQDDRDGSFNFFNAGAYTSQQITSSVEGTEDKDFVYCTDLDRLVYYNGQSWSGVPFPIVIPGNAQTATYNGRNYARWTSPGNFQVGNGGGEVQVILAGGGGGGGNSPQYSFTPVPAANRNVDSGGGGAGAYIESTTVITTGEVNVIIGQGGAGGSNGGTTTVSGPVMLVAPGGGAGGYAAIPDPRYAPASTDGNAGACGGGGAFDTQGGSAQFYGGFPGGDGSPPAQANRRSGGGGGGMGGAGAQGPAPSTQGTGGAGGAAVALPVDVTQAFQTIPTTVCGGGGGADLGAGGGGGAGSGSPKTQSQGGAAVQGTGSGGGGVGDTAPGNQAAPSGGAGGSGFVIISWLA